MGLPWNLELTPGRSGTFFLTNSKSARLSVAPEKRLQSKVRSG